jgi:hypothetical protein
MSTYGISQCKEKFVESLAFKASVLHSEVRFLDITRDMDMAGKSSNGGGDGGLVESNDGHQVQAGWGHEGHLEEVGGGIIQTSR